MNPSSPNSHCMIYTTTPSLELAKNISKHLVESKLAACANIHGPVQSIYSWEGQIENSEEFTIILKTRSSLFSKASEKINELHPYSNPCIVSLPFENGEANFLNWITSQTKGSP
jgi:periplasmic divalent cation tolerance protein